MYNVNSGSSAPAFFPLQIHSHCAALLDNGDMYDKEQKGENTQKPAVPSNRVSLTSEKIHGRFL